MAGTPTAARMWILKMSAGRSGFFRTRKRPRARACTENGGAREPPHDQALRPDERAADPGRRGTDQVVKASLRALSACSCTTCGSFEKEAQHFTTCIRSPGVSVGPRGAPARPGVPGSMQDPMFQDGAAAPIRVHGARVADPSRRLATAHRLVEFYSPL